MDTVVNWLSNIYFEHPKFQTITDNLVVTLWYGLYLFLSVACLFMAFNKSFRDHFINRFHRRCWQTSWLLQLVVILLLLEDYLRRLTMTPAEIACCYLPYVFIFLALTLDLIKKLQAAKGPDATLREGPKNA